MNLGEFVLPFTHEEAVRLRGWTRTAVGCVERPGFAISAIADYIDMVSRRIGILAGEICTQSRHLGRRGRSGKGWVIVLRLFYDPDRPSEKFKNALQELSAS